MGRGGLGVPLSGQLGASRTAPQLPTENGINTAAKAENASSPCTRFPPVVWLLARDLDAVAVLYTLNSQASRVGSLDREDWAELGVEIGGDPLGAPAYHPRALLCVWLYSFMTGVRSCRKLEAACRDQIPYPWLTGWQHPDHNTLWRFYKERQRRINLTDGDAPD